MHPAQLISAGDGVLLLASPVVNLLVRALVMLGFIRQLSTLKQARMSLSLSLNASKTSLDDMKYMPMSCQLR